MDAAILQNIFERINALYDTEGTHLCATDMLHAASNYSDPSRLEAERAVLRSQPVIIGHASKVAQLNSFMTDDSLGVPLLITRSAEGLKCFINICGHRGSKLCEDAHGTRKNFVCQYHAWSYRNDGCRLNNKEAHFPDRPEVSNKLQEVPIEERHGLLWVLATPGQSIDVRAHLGTLDDEFARWRLQDFVLERDVVMQEELNWKYVLDGFLEVYHIPVLHTRSIAPYIHGKYCIFDRYDKHSRIAVPRRSFDAIRKQPLDHANFLGQIAVNFTVFPNTIIVWQGDHFELWTVYPGNRPDVCSVRIQSLTTPEMNTEEFRSRWDRNWKVLIDTVVAEDWAISKKVQRNIPYVPGNLLRFGRNEPAMQHFHGELDREIESVQRVGGSRGRQFG